MSDSRTLRRQTSTAYDAIESIINSPVCCGFLKDFCTQEFNVESLQFIMEVDAFQSSLKVDKTSWVEDWRQVDAAIAAEMNVANIDEVIEKEKLAPMAFLWPSRQLNKVSVKADLQAIWLSFIEESAPLEICFSSNVLQRTRFRFDHFERYGPGVFMEASIDPAKTLGKDILPRFEKTAQYHRMQERVKYLNEEETANDLVVPPPEFDHQVSQSLLKEDGYTYSLKDILSEPHLYHYFHQYVTSLMSAESLLCIRLINIFEGLVTANRMKEADDIGWRIYKFFVRADSPCQISLRDKQIRTIAYNVSTPSLLTFSDLKKAAMASLTENFNSFKRTYTYQSLAEKYRTELQGGRPPLEGKVKKNGTNSRDTSNKPSGGRLFCCFSNAAVGP